MIAKLSKRVEGIEKLVSITAFIVMTLMISFNVFSRYLLMKSFAFAEEIAYLGFAWSVFLGVCRIYRQKALVAVDVLVDKLPPGAQKAIELLTSLVLAATTVAMTYYSIAITITGWSRRTSYLGIPFTFMYLPAAIGFALMSLTSIYIAVQALRDTFGAQKEREGNQ